MTKFIKNKKEFSIPVTYYTILNIYILFLENNDETSHEKKLSIVSTL